MRAETLMMIVIPFLFVTVFFTGTLAAQERVIETITVADRRAYCEQVVPKKCLQVKREIDADFRVLWDEIENFEFVEGFESVLRVEIEKKAVVPKDTSGYRYYLKEIVSRRKTNSAVSERIYTERWDLTRMRAARIDNAAAFIRFDKKEGVFFGNTGCNSMKGLFQIENGAIRFSNIVATERDCAEAGDTEALLLKNLGEIDGFKVESGRLYLTVNGAVILEFKPHLSK